MKIALRFFKNKNEILSVLTDENRYFPNKKFWLTLDFLVVSLRLIVPFFIFFQPLLVFLIFSFLDWLDYGFLTKIVIEQKRYQLIDKPLDLYSQFFMMLYGLRTEYSIVFFLLFLCRLLGTAAFLMTDKHLFLLAFPNFIEAFFLAYVLAFRFNLVLFPVFGILVVFKMIQELLLHLHPAYLPPGVLEINVGTRSVRIRVS